MITNKELIIEYVINSRITIAQDNKRGDLFYKSIINSLIESSSVSLSDELEIVECCSFNKFSSIIIRNKEGKVFLIYDTYMETINNFFNCFYGSDLEEYDSDLEKLVCGLNAEKCLLNNDKLGFVYSALKYNSKEFSLKESLIKENGFVNEIQVYFLVLHEFAHYLLNENYAQLKECGNELKEDVVGLISYLWDDLCADKDILNDFQNLKNDDNFIEECCCDIIALSFIFTRLKNTVDSFGNKKNAIKAIRWQQNTLALFSLTEDDDVSKISYFTLVSYFRVGVFRAQLSAFFEKPDLDEIELLLSELNEKCEKEFNEIFLIKFFNVEDEIKCLKTKVDNVVKYEKFSDLYNGLAIDD
jgi:hypothetical protein